MRNRMPKVDRRKSGGKPFDVSEFGKPKGDWVQGKTHASSGMLRLPGMANPVRFREKGAGLLAKKFEKGTAIIDPSTRKVIRFIPDYSLETRAEQFRSFDIQNAYRRFGERAKGKIRMPLLKFSDICRLLATSNSTIEKITETVSASRNTINAIESMFNFRPPELARQIRQMGSAPLLEKRRPQDAARAIDMLARGDSLESVAATLKIDRGALRKFAARKGIDTSKTGKKAHAAVSERRANFKEPELERILAEKTLVGGRLVYAFSPTQIGILTGSASKRIARLAAKFRKPGGEVRPRAARREGYIANTRKTILESGFPDELKGRLLGNFEKEMQKPRLGGNLPMEPKQVPKPIEREAVTRVPRAPNVTNAKPVKAQPERTAIPLPARTELIRDLNHIPGNVVNAVRFQFRMAGKTGRNHKQIAQAVSDNIGRVSPQEVGEMAAAFGFSKKKK